VLTVTIALSDSLWTRDSIPDQAGFVKNLPPEHGLGALAYRDSHKAEPS